MAEKFFPLEGHVYTAEEASLWFATRTSGVHASDSLKVSAAGGMTVHVGKGVAWLHYAEFAGVSYANTATKALTIADADATLDRIDRIVVRYSKATNSVALAVLQGTPAGNPTAPEITRNAVTHEISVARVMVAANATSITDGDITDERTDNAVCGLMSDGVTAYVPGEGGGSAAAEVFAEDANNPGCFYRTNASGVREWINPPMASGVEYLTIEKYKGHPVYTALIDLGTSASNKQISLTTELDGQSIVRFAGRAEIYGLPFINTSFDNGYSGYANARCNNGKIEVNMKGGSSFGTRKVFVQVWYCRDWVS